jgi:hypothetical protein
MVSYGEINSSTHFIGWMGPTADLNSVQKRIIYRYITCNVLGMLLVFFVEICAIAKNIHRTSQNITEIHPIPMLGYENPNPPAV